MKTIFKKNGGFTLVELIVVIAILAILGGVAVPAYSGYIAKANQQADISLVSDVKDAMILYYYNTGSTTGSVVITPEGVVCKFDENGKAAMDAVFGEGWENNMSLKYDGWKNSQAGITAAVAGSNFSDAEGNVNMELLNTVDNLTGQLGEAMTVLDWNNFAGFTGFLGSNGIDLEKDPQLAANSAVLYLAQGSVDKDNRVGVTNLLKEEFKNGAQPTPAGGASVNLEAFLAKATLEYDCTEFEALAMVYSAMAGYCLQKGDDTFNEFIAMDILNKDAAGNPTVSDEGDVLRALQSGFANILTTEDDDFDYDFYSYLNNGNLGKDIDAYYGVIDGISENHEYLMGNLNGNENFYASQKGLLSAYLDLDIASGEIGVILTVPTDGQPQAIEVGMSE